MIRSLSLLLALASSAAWAQSDAHTIHVFATDSGVAYATEGETASNGPIVQAGGFLIVRASDSLRVMVVVGPDGQGISGTVGANAAFPAAWHGTSVLRLRPYVDGYGGPPTYHPVSIFVCTAEPPRSAFYEGTPGEDGFYDHTPAEGLPCLAWQAVAPVAYSPTPGGPMLEINDGLRVYAPPAPYRGGDPPVGEPIDPED